MIGIYGVEHRRECCVSSIKPPPRQHEHRRTCQNQRDPDVDWRGNRPGKDEADQSTKRPRRWRIENKSRLSESEMRQRGPSRIQNSVPPLTHYFEPRIQMKLNVMTRRSSEKEERSLRREHGRTDQEQRRP